MKETYPFKPAAVEVFRLGKDTDVILRKDIAREKEEDEQTGKSRYVWNCDERQFRYPGTLEKVDVEADFDAWWGYTPPDPEPRPEAGEPTLSERVEALEALALEQMMGGIKEE